MADTDHEALLRKTYAAFNARDIDAVLATMHPDVDWPNAWEGGRVHGHGAVRGYWTRQWAEIDPTVEPTDIAPPDADGRVAVTVHLNRNLFQISIIFSSLLVPRNAFDSAAIK